MNCPAFFPLKSNQIKVSRRQGSQSHPFLLKTILLGFAVLILTACSTVTKISSINPLRTSAGKDQSLEVNAAPKLTEAQLENTTPQSSAPVAPKILIDDLLGQNANDIDQLLGRPQFVRREGAGEFRRYANSECNLIVIFYPSDQGRTQSRPIATNINAAALFSGDHPPDLQTCLNQF